MSVATLASRGVGFVKVWVIAAVLGATYLGNTYQASSSVSNVLFELIAAGALSAVLVPTFVDLFRAGDDAEAERLASGVLGLALAIMAVVSIVGMVFATPIARVLSSSAPNAHIESQQVALSAFFLRFFIPQVLLGAALVMGNQVAGGVVAYQFCFVAFLAPYAILAQPIHTSLLPELTVDAGNGDLASFADRLRWGLDGMSRLLLPVSAAYVALALPAMRVLAVGNSRHDADLFAAVLASLGVGLFTYGTFLFFARASYALGDSRTPAIVAGGSALIGAAVMVVGGLTFETDTAKVAALGRG